MTKFTLALGHFALLRHFSSGNIPTLVRHFAKNWQNYPQFASRFGNIAEFRYGWMWTIGDLTGESEGTDAMATNVLLAGLRERSHAKDKRKPGMRTACHSRQTNLEESHAMLPDRERRSRSRSRVQWTIQFTGTGEDFKGATRDLSCENFYCLADRPLTRGSRVTCTIMVPGHEPECSDCVHLECDVEVVRVEPAGGCFGIACRILKYSVIAQRAKN